MSVILEAAAESRPGARLVHRRGWLKPDIKHVVRNGAPLILKDFSEKSFVVRWLGRLQVRREIRALARLRGVAGVPACHGLAGWCGVLLERMEGERITRVHRRPQGEIALMLDRLERLVGELHARGVVHLDLRKRDNILVDALGRPGIIDFNAALCIGPKGLAARLLFPLLKRIDTSALLKWKTRLAPDLLTPAEERRHRRMSVARRFWVFN